MASTRVIRQIGDYVLIHDTLQGLFRVADGTDISFYFDSETRDELLEMDADAFRDEVKRLIELSEVDVETDPHRE